MSDTATNGTAETEIVLTLVLFNHAVLILKECGLILPEEVRSCIERFFKVGGGGKA